MEDAGGTTLSKGPSLLWQRWMDTPARALSVMGLAKNTGKTVALNHLLAQAHEHGCLLGITSIGRDGEARDEVYQIPKPPVKVTPGLLVATAQLTLARARVPWQWVGDTGVETPMGEVRIVRALAHGDMEVAGASRGQDQGKVIAQLYAAGATRVILDGALGRSHHASPALTQAVLLATGAALGSAPEAVLRYTRERISLLQLPQAPADWLALTAPVFEQGGVGVWQADGLLRWRDHGHTLNAAERLRPHLAEAPGVLAFSGAVGRLLWREVLACAQRVPQLTVVVADGTRLFIDRSEVAALQATGGRLWVHRPISLLGVTLNPTSPHGPAFAPDTFLLQARAALPDMLVDDLVWSATTD